MSGEPSNCPRCAAALQRRLADLECPACGWFKPARGDAASRPAAAKSGHDPTAAAGGSSRLQSSVDQPAGAGRGQGAYRGSLHVYERAPIDAFERAKLLFIIIGGLLFTAGNLALLWAVPAVFPSNKLIGAVALGSLLAVGIGAVILFVDWAAVKLVGALLALSFIALDVVLSVPLWTQYFPVARVKHIIDALLLLVFAGLLIHEWRRENTPVDA